MKKFKNMKYTNIESELPRLQSVLKNAIQKDVLDIKTLDDNSDKFRLECQNCPILKNAQYVVYSPHMQKQFQEYEHYVFLDKLGNTLCHKSGQDFHLYGMLKPCVNLEVFDIKDQKTYQNQII